jgi:hypothetical protein
MMGKKFKKHSAKVDTPEVTRDLDIDAADLACAPVRFLVVRHEPLRCKQGVLYLWQQDDHWRYRIFIFNQKLTGDLSQDTEPLMVNWLKPYLKVSSHVNVTSFLPNDLKSYLTAKYTGLSLHQRECIKGFLKGFDIWPIQEDLTPTQQKTLISLYFKRVDPSDLDDDLIKTIYETFLKITDPKRLIFLEKPTLFYADGDQEKSIATQATLKIVYQYIYLLLSGAAHFVKFAQDPSLPFLVGNVSLESTIGCIQTAGTLEAWEEELVGYFFYHSRLFEIQSLEMLQTLKRKFMALNTPTTEMLRVYEHIHIALMSSFDVSTETAKDMLHTAIAPHILEKIQLSMDILELVQRLQNNELDGLSELIDCKLLTKDSLMRFLCKLPCSLYHACFQMGMETIHRRFERSCYEFGEFLITLDTPSQTAYLEALGPEILVYINTFDDLEWIVTPLYFNEQVVHLQSEILTFVGHNLTRFVDTPQKYAHLYATLAPANRQVLLNFLAHDTERFFHSRAVVDAFFACLDIQFHQEWMSLLSYDQRSHLLNLKLVALKEASTQHAHRFHALPISRAQPHYAACWLQRVLTTCDTSILNTLPPYVIHAMGHCPELRVVYNEIRELMWQVSEAHCNVDVHYSGPQ